MTIPSPRKFIETCLCFIVAAVFLACFAFVVLAMAIFAFIETMVDRVKVKGRRQL